MNRPMTAAERAEYKGYFPNLNVNVCRVTDNKTSVYNCIAWTVGVNWNWLWPGPTIAHFDTFYRGWGFYRAGSGSIAVWAKNGDTNKMTHGCVSGSEHGPRWESKCGSGLRIQHGLNELRGVLYGQVVAYYDRFGGGAARESAARFYEEQKKVKDIGIMLLSDYQSKTLKRLVSEVDREVVEQFETKFQNWKDVWEAGYRQLLSDPSCVKDCDEYVELANMGQVIMPLLIEKMTDPDNFRALQLYDDLQNEQYLLILPGSSEEIMLKGEQFRAQKVVKHWLSSI